MSNKFITTLEDHQRNKASFNLRHGWPHKAAADPEWLQQWIAEKGPYLYHGTSPEAAQQISQEGLYPHDHGLDPNGGLEERSRSHWAGDFLEPRAGHTYLANADMASRHATTHGAMLQVDLRHLDPGNLTADEDAFATYNDHPAVDSVWGYEPPPSSEHFRPSFEAEEEIGPDGHGQTLGDWADQLGLGNNPEETHYSLENFGTVAHRGVIPPKAITVLQRDQYPSAPKPVYTYSSVASAAPEPPNFRKATGSKHCGSCKMFSQGKCWGYGNKPVDRDDVCDSWAQDKTSSSYKEFLANPEAGPSLIKIAQEIESRGLSEGDAVAYAHQALTEHGFEPTKLNLQAAIQIWQTEVANKNLQGLSGNYHNRSVTAVKKRKWVPVPFKEDDDTSTEPTPDDRWPEFGDVPPDKHRDVQFSNDYVAKTAIVEPLEPHLTLYHGTTNKALDLARKRGGLYSWSPREVADEVAGHYGLDPEEFYHHPYFEFSRSGREGDHMIYTHTEPRVAQSYANQRSEQLHDALMTAHRMMNPKLYDDAAVEGFSGAPGGYQQALKTSREQHVNDYYQQHNIQPMVVKLNVPYSQIPANQQKQLEGGRPGSTTFLLPEPARLDWMSPQPHLAMAADPYWLDHWMERHGPYLYHHTDQENIPKILENGLLPWDAPGIGSKYHDDLEPRPNHVYLRHHPRIDNPSATMLRVDLRKLDPERLNPDEDQLTGPNASRVWGWEDEGTSSYPYKSFGEKAEALNQSTPAQTAWSLEAPHKTVPKALGTLSHGTIAHNGPIPPEAIDYPWGMARASQPSHPVASTTPREWTVQEIV